jgi:hypothetical protein
MKLPGKKCGYRNEKLGGIVQHLFETTLALV